VVEWLLGEQLRPANVLLPFRFACLLLTAILCFKPLGCGELFDDPIPSVMLMRRYECDKFMCELA